MCVAVALARPGCLAQLCEGTPEHVRPPDHMGVMEKMLLNFPPYTSQTNTAEEQNLCQSNRRGVLYPIPAPTKYGLTVTTR